MAQVTARDHEPIDSLLRRFKNEVGKEGIIGEMRKRAAYMKPGEKRRLKHRKEMKRRRHDAGKVDTSERAFLESQAFKQREARRQGGESKGAPQVIVYHREAA